MPALQLPNVPIDSSIVRQPIATDGVHLFGIRLVGFNAHTGTKLLLTTGVIPPIRVRLSDDRPPRA